MKTVRESSACTIRTRFFDANQVPAIPSNARYRLRDVTNNRTIIDWTDLTPDASVDVQVAPESNVIFRDSVASQEHAFVVQADAGLSSQWTDEVRYQVLNLRGFESR